MKILSRFFSLLFVTSLGLAFTGCGGGDDGEDSAEKVELGKLSGTWEVSAVTLDDIEDERTEAYKGLDMTISGTYANDGESYQYTFTGKLPKLSVWEQTGNWHFGNVTTAKTMTRDVDKLSMTYTVTDTQLTISFNYTGEGFNNGRVQLVQGNWKFTYTKK